MKHLLVVSLIFLFALSCKNSKQVDVLSKKNDTGYTVGVSKHIDFVKDLNKASINYDTALMRKFYTGGSDSVHVNTAAMGLDENLTMVYGLKSQGIQIQIDNYPAIWETVNNMPNAKGCTHFVIAYIEMTLRKDDKEKKLLFNQICAFKDDKIIEEWNFYDTAPFTELNQQ